jgi:16S rRNA (cytidine1402-2'-O)-methyltransferase
MSANLRPLPPGLTLIPTPLQEDLPLEPVALEWLRSAAANPQALLLVEEHKAARIRWLHWGLPRESIDRFVCYNEHTSRESMPEVLQKLNDGHPAILISDGGLPAFCDPGRNLVDACHEAGIRVSASPFPNSVALAVALSGFDHGEFHFCGFLPAESVERKRALEKISKTQTCTLVLMDTPYRLQALLSDLASSPLRSRRVFLAVELNGSGETLYRGKIEELIRKTAGSNKLEFVAVLAPAR